MAETEMEISTYHLFLAERGDICLKFLILFLSPKAPKKAPYIENSNRCIKVASGLIICAELAE